MKHFLLLKGGCATFPQWRGLNGPKFRFCHREKFLMGGWAQTFLTSKLTLKPYYGAFSGNLKRMFLRKMHFYFHPFQPKTTIFGLLRGHFWPKTWKIKCFQFIQSKISQFGTQMWLPKKLQFLVPGTPPEPPIPPLTPPRGPGGPKMAKMHSLKSNDDS